MIRFENVSKTYKNGTPALKDISLDIEKGEFVFLVGASGSGKTTFLALAAARGASRQGPHPRSGSRHRRVAEVARAVPATQHRLRLPGLPSPAEQDRLRERGVRPRGHRSSALDGRVPGSSDPRARRTLGQVQEPARTSSPAASSSASPSRAPSSIGRSSCSPTSRPATSTRRTPSRSWRCSSASIAPARRSSWPRTTRRWSTGCVGASIELDRGEMIRDQVRGVYGIDEGVAI